MTIYPTIKNLTSLVASAAPENTESRLFKNWQSAEVTQQIQKNFLQDKIEAKHFLREVFGTQNTHTFGVDGSGFSGLDCVLSMILPGDTVVAFVNRKFNGIGSLTIRANTTTLPNLEAKPINTPFENVVIVNVPHDEPISQGLINDTLAEHQPMWSIMSYSETHSHCINDVKGFNDACAKQGAMGIIDAVSSSGIDSFDIDEYPGIVAWASCPQQKVLSLAATYSPVSFRYEAIELIKQRGCYPFRHHPISEARHWGIVDGEDVDTNSA